MINCISTFSPAETLGWWATFAVHYIAGKTDRKLLV
jgi:hypothetical protein